MRLEYAKIEEQLTDALPELRPAAERYWATEGKPGYDSGPYIFFESMFATFVELMLAMPQSPRRNQLLAKAFTIVEEMIGSGDPDVVNLAYIGLYEGRAPWWFACAEPFIGTRASAQLDRFAPNWRSHAQSRAAPNEQENAEFIDLYGVRCVIACELAADGVGLPEVPGVTPPRV